MEPRLEIRVVVDIERLLQPRKDPADNGVKIITVVQRNDLRVIIIVELTLPIVRPKGKFKNSIDLISRN